MDILIDGTRDLAYADPGSALGEILDQLQTWLGRNGRAIVGVSLDGTVLDPAGRENVRREKVDTHQALEVTTLCPSELSLLTLAELAKHLPALGKGLATAASHFQKGALPLGMSLLRDAVTGLQVTMDTMTKVCQLSAIDLAAVKSGAKTGMDAITHLRDRLRDVQEALKSKDTVTLADMCEYELAPAVKEWEELVRRLEDLIKQKHA